MNEAYKESIRAENGAGDMLKRCKKCANYSECLYVYRINTCLWLPSFFLQEPNKPQGRYQGDINGNCENFEEKKTDEIVSWIKKLLAMR